MGTRAPGRDEYTEWMLAAAAAGERRSGGAGLMLGAIALAALLLAVLA